LQQNDWVVFVWQTDSLTWALTRKKTESEDTGKEKLKRVLTFFDLTALGTGATLGCGVYVLAGAVAKSIAGPAVVLSFAIAAVVSGFSGKDMRVFFNPRAPEGKKTKSKRV
jgi:amino acid permease